MAEVSVRVLVPPERAFAALIDPSTYPRWLVGCREIRAIDDDWPAPGSRFHHRFGLIGPHRRKDSPASSTTAPQR